jgi:hypothetical protein
MTEHDGIDAPADAVNAGEPHLAEAHQRSEAAAKKLARAIQATEGLPAKTDAVIIKELEIAAQRYKADLERQVALEKIAADERVARLQTELKRLEGESALALAREKGATDRAIAAETAVEQVKANTATTVERVKARATRNTAIWSAGSAIAVALVGIIVAYVNKTQGDKPHNQTPNADPPQATSEKPPPPADNAGEAAAVVKGEALAKKLDGVLKSLPWPHAKGSSVVNVWLTTASIPEGSFVGDVGSIKSLACDTQGSTDMCGLLTSQVVQAMRESLPSPVSAVALRIEIGNNGLYVGVISNQVEWYSWTKYE